jgi:HSP20 family protein
MVDKVLIKQKMRNIKSTVSEKKEDFGDKINDMKGLAKDKKDDMQVEAGKWRKLAPKLFV